MIRPVARQADIARMRRHHQVTESAPAQSPQRRPPYGSHNTHSGAEQMTAPVTRLPRITAVPARRAARKVTTQRDDS